MFDKVGPGTGNARARVWAKKFFIFFLKRVDRVKFLCYNTDTIKENRKEKNNA